MECRERFGPKGRCDQEQEKENRDKKWSHDFELASDVMLQQGPA